LEKVLWLRKLWQFDWPYWAGGVCFALLNIGLLAFAGRPWGVTTAVACWGAEAARVFGASPDKWMFFREVQKAGASVGTSLCYVGTVLNLGVILGSFISSFLLSEFRFRGVKTLRQATVVLIGGFLMGYGARVALGCNVGGLIGGISSLSLHGWVYALFILTGAYLGTRFIIRYLL